MEYLGNIYDVDKKDVDNNGFTSDENRKEDFTTELACWIDGCGAKVCGIKIW